MNDPTWGHDPLFGTTCHTYLDHKLALFLKLVKGKQEKVHIKVVCVLCPQKCIVSSGFSGFLLPPKNMPVDGLTEINQP